MPELYLGNTKLKGICCVRLRDWLLPVCMIFILILVIIFILYGLHIGSPDGAVFILVGGTLEIAGVVTALLTSKRNKAKS